MNSRATALCANRQRVVVVTTDSIEIYSLQTMKAIHSIGGLRCGHPAAAISVDGDKSLLAYGVGGRVVLFDAIKLEAVGEVDAHENPVVVVALSHGGEFLATSSTRVASQHRAQLYVFFRR